MLDDIHICGSCKQEFTCISSFLKHKQDECCMASGSASTEGNPSTCGSLSDCESVAMTTLFSNRLNAVDNNLHQSPSNNQNSKNCRSSLMSASTLDKYTSSSQEIVSTSSSRDIISSVILIPTGLPLCIQPNTLVKDAPVYKNGLVSNQTSVVNCSDDNTQLMLTADGSWILVPYLNTSVVTSQTSSSTLLASSSLLSSSSVTTTVSSNSVSSRKFSCTVAECSYSSSYQKDLQRHSRIHTGDKPFVCSVCEKRFSRDDKLKLHHRIHTQHKPYKCDICSYCSSDGSLLKKHKRIHSGEKPYKCQICSYACRSSSQLVVHLRTHTGDAPYVCDVCDAKFKINSDLKRHKRRHSGEKPFQCDHCDYRCTIKGNLKTHCHTNHNSTMILRCGACSFRASSNRSLREHSKSHEEKRRFICSVCAYSCVSRTSLKTHLTIHSPEKPFRCNVCSYTCRQRGNLKTHMNRRHINHKNAIPSGRYSARRRRHSGSLLRGVCRRNYRCQTCGLAFVREEALRSHIAHHCQATDVAVNSKQQTNCTAGRESSKHRPTISDDLDQRSSIRDEGIMVSRSSEPHDSLTGLNEEQQQSHPVRLYSEQQFQQNLLAFIENNQNLAIEQNLSNLSAETLMNDQALSSVAVTTALSDDVTSGLNDITAVTLTDEMSHGVSVLGGQFQDVLHIQRNFESQDDFETTTPFSSLTSTHYQNNTLNSGRFDVMTNNINETVQDCSEVTVISSDHTNANS